MKNENGGIAKSALAEILERVKKCQNVNMKKLFFESFKKNQ